MAYIPFLNNAYFSAKVGIGTGNISESFQVYEVGNTAYKSYTNANAGAILTCYQSDSGSPYLKTTDLAAGSDGTVPSEIRFLTRTSGTATIDPRMIITSSGNVGIGTTSPSTFDALADNFVINAPTSAGMTISESTGSGTSNILFAATSSFANRGNISYDHNATAMTFGINASEKMRIDSAGKVGIGTTSPGGTLHVVGETGNSGSIYLSDRDNGTGTGDALLINKSGVSAFIYNRDGGQLSFGTNNVSNNLVIANTGNVGIGTTNPGHKLTVNAANNTTAVGIDFPSAHFNFSANSTSGYTSNFRLDNVGMDIGHDSTSRSLNLQTGNLDRVTILGNGNVGIGTDSPNYKLAVEGSIAIQDAENLWLRGGRVGFENAALNNAAYIYNIGAAGSSKLNIADSLYVIEAGNVGIGTDSPARDFVVSNGGASGVEIQANIEAGVNEILSFDRVTSAYETMRLNGGDFEFRIAGDQKVIIDSSGNVGIGTTSPNAKLDVSGGLNSVHAIFSGQDGRGLKLSTENTLSNDDGVVYDAQSSTGVHLFKTNATERMRITSGGNVNINGTNNRPLAITSFDTVSTGAGWDLDATSNNGVITMSTGGTERMRIGSDGNVTMEGALNVAGVSTLANVGYLGDGLGSVQYTLQSANDGYGIIDFGDVADVNIGRLSYNHNDNSFSIRTNNTTALTLNSSQNATFAGNVALTTGSQLFFDNGNTYISEDIADRLRFFVGGSEFMRFTEDTSDNINFYHNATFTGTTTVQGTGDSSFVGNVGIGTASPDQKLHIKGGDIQTQDTTGSNGVLRIRATITGTPSTGGYPNVGAGDAVIEGGGTTQRHPGVITLMNGDSSISSGQDLGVIQFVGKDDSATGYCTSQIISTTSGAMGAGVSGGGILRFLTSPGNTGATPQEAMRITNTGNVGIGVTSTNSKLEVGGQSKISGNVIIGTETNAGANLFLKDATTTSANSKSLFIVSQNSGRSFLSLVTANSGEAQIGFGTSQFASQNTSGSIQYTTSTKQFTFKTNFTLALTIANNQAATFTNTVTATNFILSSDKKLKNNIKEIDTSHIDVNWKNFELKSDPGVKRAGVIAQELEEKHPEFVRTDDEGMKSVAYIDLLITKIAELEARLEKLEK